ncbi:MAG: hypothetical protein OHK0050_27130 [Roseiflexaceae bacterium]
MGAVWVVSELPNMPLWLCVYRDDRTPSDKDAHYYMVFLYTEIEYKYTKNLVAVKPSIVELVGFG